MNLYFYLLLHNLIDFYFFKYYLFIHILYFADQLYAWPYCWLQQSGAVQEIPHPVKCLISMSNLVTVVNEYMNTVHPGEIKRIDRCL